MLRFVTLIFFGPFILVGKWEDLSLRQTIERSIPYIELKGQEWIKKNKCVSCHQVNTMIWSLSLAKQKGFMVSEKLESWIDWSVKESLKTNEKEKVVGRLNKEGVAQILFADLKIEDSKREKLLDLLALDQKKDGTWDAGGAITCPEETGKGNIFGFIILDCLICQTESFSSFNPDYPCKERRTKY